MNQDQAQLLLNTVGSFLQSIEATVKTEVPAEPKNFTSTASQTIDAIKNNSIATASALDQVTNALNNIARIQAMQLQFQILKEMNNGQSASSEITDRGEFDANVNIPCEPQQTEVNVRTSLGNLRVPVGNKAGKLKGILIYQPCTNMIQVSLTNMNDIESPTYQTMCQDLQNHNILFTSRTNFTTTQSSATQMLFYLYTHYIDCDTTHMWYKS